MIGRERAHRLILLAVLLLGLWLRLYHVTYPYLDHHSWRQTDTAAIARNFFRHGFNILRPEVDWAGDQSSVVELELQLTPFLTAGLYALWGIKDWVGRVIPILFSLASIVYFHRLVRVHTNEELALFAAFVYAILPLNAFFSRVLMPESGASFFAVAALYHLSGYLREQTTRQYALATLAAALAFLSKLTNLYLLIPLLAMSLAKYRMKLFSDTRLVGYVIVPLAVTVAYYAHMHASADIPLIPYRIGSDKWGHLTIWTNALFYRVMLARFWTVVFTGAGVLLLASGLLLPVRTRLFHVWFLSALAYVFLVAFGNMVHSYYQMPLIPAGSFFIGLALYHLYVHKRLRPLSVLLCACLLYLSVANLRPMHGMYAYPAYEAAMKLRQIDAANSLVLYVPHRRDMNPEMLYYADRKGWVMWPEDVSLSAIEAFRTRGARYLVMTEPRALTAEVIGYLRTKERWLEKRYIVIRL